MLERRENGSWEKHSALSIPVELHPEVTWGAKLLDGRLEECQVAEVLSCRLKLDFRLNRDRELTNAIVNWPMRSLLFCATKPFSQLGGAMPIRKRIGIGATAFKMVGTNALNPDAFCF